MSTISCLEVMCPFKDCESHWTKGEHARKADWRKLSPECRRYQAYRKEQEQKSLASDLATIHHLRSGKY